MRSWRRRPPRTLHSAIRNPQSVLNLNVILDLVEQSAARLRFDDFRRSRKISKRHHRLPAPGRLGVRSISEFIDFAQVQGFLRDKVRYSLDDSPAAARERAAQPAAASISS